MDDADSDLSETSEQASELASDPVIPPVKRGRGRPKGSKGKARTKKDPRAPKRSKSAYIFFAMEKREQVKLILGPGARVGDIAKKTSEMWKSISEAERKRWESVASADRDRYMEEKSNYTGPMLLPKTEDDARDPSSDKSKMKKQRDPDAPRRPLTAFMYFSQHVRPSLKKHNPTWGIADLAKELGRQWREMPEDARTPFVQHEIDERRKYAVLKAEYMASKGIAATDIISDPKEDSIKHAPPTPPKPVKKAKISTKSNTFTEISVNKVEQTQKIDKSIEATLDYVIHDREQVKKQLVTRKQQHEPHQKKISSSKKNDSSRKTSSVSKPSPRSLPKKISSPPPPPPVVEEEDDLSEDESQDYHEPTYEHLNQRIAKSQTSSTLAQAQAEAKALANGLNQAQAQAEAKALANALNQAQAQLRAQTQANLQAHLEAHAHSQAQAQANVNTQAQSKTSAQSQAQAQAQADVKLKAQSQNAASIMNKQHLQLLKAQHQQQLQQHQEQKAYEVAKMRMMQQNAAGLSGMHDLYNRQELSSGGEGRRSSSGYSLGRNSSPAVPGSEEELLASLGGGHGRLNAAQFNSLASMLQDQQAVSNLGSFGGLSGLGGFQGGQLNSQQLQLIMAQQQAAAQFGDLYGSLGGASRVGSGGGFSGLPGGLGSSGAFSSMGGGLAGLGHGGNNGFERGPTLGSGGGPGGQEDAYSAALSALAAGNGAAGNSGLSGGGLGPIGMYGGYGGGLGIDLGSMAGYGNFFGGLQ